MTITVYLYKRSRPDRGTPATWYIKWPGPAGKMVSEAVINPATGNPALCADMTKAEAKEIRKQKELALNTGKAAITHATKAGLLAFIEIYRAGRKQSIGGKGLRKGLPKLDQKTIDGHVMALRFMVQFFGESRALSSITGDDIEAFTEALQRGELDGARKESKRAYTMGEQTIRKHLRAIRAVYTWAKRKGFAASNPVEEFDTKCLPGEETPYVPAENVQAVINRAQGGWKVLFALCRYAGLRREEARTLPWSGRATDKRGKSRFVGVELDKRLLHVVSPKTKLYRVVPINPKLYTVLQAASVQANGSTICGLSENNLTRNGQKLVEAAGLKVWSKLYQAMRKSCEDDWKQQGIAEATYANWMGHSVKVSREHYVTPQDSEFAAVIGKIGPEGQAKIEAA